MELLINPDLDEVRDAVLAGLNRCFPDWGGKADFRWHFMRVVGSRPPDMMIIREGGSFVAGSAVVYRPVVLGTGQATEVGIMASSWTLPEARGKGHFARIVEESVRLARAKEAALLLAYVTSINASARRLFASGAAGYPTHYLISDPSTPTPATELRPSVVERSQEGIERFMEVSVRRARACRFVYALEEWRGQFWERPNATTVVRVGDVGTALMETKKDFDRLLAFSSADERAPDCLAPLLAWSHSRGQKFFFFTTDDHWKNRAIQLGLRHLPGFLTARLASGAAIRQSFPEAAREAMQPQALSDPHSPHFAGPWFIQNGDRM